MSEEEIFEIIAKSSASVVSIETHSLLNDEISEMRGSGFVVDNEGHIVTNHHVIRDSKNVYVIHEGSPLDGRVIYASKITDLAILQVDANLPPVELGDSDNARIGQNVYVIGNPFGIRGRPTVTAGIISGIRRLLKVKTGAESFFLLDVLETDADLNSGNSGGIMIDAEGRVIGVPTAVASLSGGIGFNIPINLVKDYLNQVKTKGRYSIPWIGLDGITITPHINKYFRLGTDYGVLVVDVIRDSPAEKAGLRRSKRLSLLEEEEYPPKSFGSIISFNGSKVEGFEELLRMVLKSTIGSTAKLGVLTKGHLREIEVEIGEIS